jgi:hypothetical protein
LRKAAYSHPKEGDFKLRGESSKGKRKKKEVVEEGDKESDDENDRGTDMVEGMDIEGKEEKKKGKAEREGKGKKKKIKVRSMIEKEEE